MQRIDGRGKWLMPGLTDMHVHLENIRMLKLVMNTASVPADAVRNEDVFFPVIGHLPEREQGHTAEFFRPGFGMVAHAEEFAQQTSAPSLEAIPRYVELMKRNGTWLTATLVPGFSMHDDLNALLRNEALSPVSVSLQCEPGAQPQGQ